MMAVTDRYSTLIAFSCERSNLLCSHSNGDPFTCEDIMLSCKSSRGISLVFIYKKIYVNSCDETNVRNERMIMHFTRGIQSMKSISVNTNQYQLID